MKTAEVVRIHRWADLVAFDTDEMAETVYLSPLLAYRFAFALIDYADDIAALEFCHSPLATTRLDNEPTGDGAETRPVAAALRSALAELLRAYDADENGRELNAMEVGAIIEEAREALARTKGGAQ